MIWPNITLGGQAFSYAASSTRPYAIGPMTLTVNNGTAIGAVRDLTATFSFIDERGAQDWLHEGAAAAVDVQMPGHTVQALRGTITEITVTRAPATRRNPQRRGIRATVSCSVGSPAIRHMHSNGEIAALPLGFSGAASNVRAIIARITGQSWSLSMPSKPLMDHGILASQLSDGQTLHELISFVAEANGHRAWVQVTPTSRRIGFMLARANAPASHRIPAKYVEDAGEMFTNKQRTTPNIVTVTHVNDQPSGDPNDNGTKVHEVRFEDGPAVKKYGAIVENHAVRLFGRKSATSLAGQLIQRPRIRWTLDKIKVLLDPALDAGEPVHTWLKAIFAFGHELPTFHVAGIPSLAGLPTLVGGIADKAVLTINPSPTRSGPRRAVLELDLGTGDVFPTPGNFPPEPEPPPASTWARHTGTWQATTTEWRNS
ncbi:hypothetical protein [Brevibacterium otitidis]|uniref:Uncharacterized protein n=1 Tax=Brevibacterium otitidis TaxID=53364 RepID=A0ABV5WYV9_9MICO|nr:hypothetical protein GCM10023233_25870 [Brevibacterium otitidis]